MPQKCEERQDRLKRLLGRCLSVPESQVLLGVVAGGDAGREAGVARENEVGRFSGSGRDSRS